MARKAFVPRMTGLSNAQIENELNRIKEVYDFLTETNLKWLKMYCEPYSDHLGTIITEGGSYPVWPSQDMDSERFLQDNPAGEIWEFKSEK